MVGTIFRRISDTFCLSLKFFFLAVYYWISYRV